MNERENFELMLEKYRKEMQSLIDNAKTISNQPIKKEKKNAESDIIPPSLTNQNVINETELQSQKNFAITNQLSETRTKIKPKKEKITQTSMMPNAFGTLVVSATSANSALPVENAHVLISESAENGSKLIFSLKTDRNGETETVSLETYPIELSQNPDFYGKPYKTYDIRVQKDGYFTIVAKEVPIFANRQSIQPINMIPLPENYIGDTVREVAEYDSLTEKPAE